MQLNFTHTTVCKKNLYPLYFFVLLLSLVAGACAEAQLVAFPGAEGAGRFASGGRGTATSLTTVFEVTNLADDNNPGSLRYALQASTATYPHRTIVFRISSGTIHLTSRLTIRGNTTIAGQTAPGDGICIADHPIVISGDNIILRYIRVRMGDKNQNKGMVDGSGSDDALGNIGNKNIIIDHCTVSWSSDEALTIYRGDSITLQWNIISEPLNYSYHFETGDTDFERHGYGGIWGGRHASFHHNLIAHVQGRAPRFDGSRNLPPFTPGQENSDFRNNVIYNWGAYNVNGGEGGNYNIVNNYYKWGPSTATGSSSGVPVRSMIINPGKQTSAPVLPYGKYYVTGNYVDGSSLITANNWRGAAMSGGSLADTTSAKVEVPWDIAPVTTHTAEAAYNLVLQKAGTVLPLRDTLDQRIVADVRNRTGQIIDVQGGYPHGTPYAQTVTAWPSLNSITALADDDHDGMPNAWETAKVLNPNDAADRGVIGANGYTHLENYLNGLAETSITTTGSLSPFRQNVGTPSAPKTYSVSATALSSDLTIAPPSHYEVSANGNTWFTNATPLVLPAISGVVAATTISVRLHAPAAGVYSGSIVHSGVGMPSVTIPVTGSTTAIPSGVAVVVAQDGTGNYTTVQAAINAAPTGLTAPYIIFIKNGKYKEKIVIPANKPFLHLVGESVANTIITYNDGASTPLPGGGTVGTFNSYTVYVNAADFAAVNITFENSFGDGSQAVAVHVNADRAAFKNCRFLGNQDTLLTNGNSGLRQYFKNCYIDGNVDFIFGSARAIFDSCIIYAKTRTNAGSSYITAANTQAGQPFGYVFRNCTIPSNTGGTSYYLGRPWQNSTGSSPVANNKVVFLNTMMGYTVRPEGWSVWDAGTVTNLIYFGEYKTKNMDGTLANVSARVPWSFQLTDAEAATYTDATLFGTWNPCAIHADFCNGNSRDIAITNFRGVKGATNATLTWNPAWALPGIRYELFRSANRTGSYSKAGEVGSVNDTSYNFGLTDALAPAGNSYYYYLSASKGGLATHISDTIELSSIPVITTSGSLSSFTQNYGSPSTAQVITVSGTNLTNNITITPPPNFEVSSNGTTWFTNTTPLVLTQTNNAVAATTISVRLNAALLGTYSGNLVLASAGVTTVNIPLTGTTAIIPPPDRVTIQQWPFTINGGDSAAVRSPGVTPSTPTLNKLYLSNGITVPALQSYTPTYGQAFGASANGDGTWTTTIGGPGGNLNRTHYEQFTVTASAGYSVRVDSIALHAAFYNTSSNTKLAVVYSKSGFALDSADVAGGTDASGILLSTANGAFATPVLLINQPGGPTNYYSFALTGANGVTVAAGQTVTIRLYFSSGTTSPGRYAMVKNVRAIGQAINLSTPPTISTNNTFSNFVQIAGAPSAVQTYTVSGTNLSGNILLVPPPAFELSSDGGATWSGSTAPLIIPTVSGTISATTISVRLNAAALGTSSGNIMHLSAGATTVNVAVTGVTVPPPVITTAGTLTPFSQTIGAPSAVQAYTLSGATLLGNITINPPPNYEVSLDGSTWFGTTTPLIITQTSGAIGTTTVRVRLSATAPGSYTGTIIHSSSGVDKSVAVTGTTVLPPVIIVSSSFSAFTQTLGNPSATQSYTINGSNLTGNVTIIAPSRYQVSTDGVAWSNTLTVMPLNGSIVTTVLIRLASPVTGFYSGNVVNVTTDAATVNIAVTGIVTVKEKYLIYPNPAYRVFFFAHPVTTGKAALSIYNSSGIKLKIYNTVPGTIETSIDVSKLPMGVYFVEYVYENEKVVFPFIRN